MAINKDTHVNASVILPVEIYDQIKAEARMNKRSASSHMAYLIENGMEEKYYGLESENELRKQCNQ